MEKNKIEDLPEIKIEDLKKDRLITMKRGAAICGVTTRTLYNRLTEGHFHFVNYPGKVMIWENSLYDYLKRLTEIAIHKDEINLETIKNLEKG